MLNKDAVNNWITEHGLEDAYSVNSGMCEEFAQHFMHQIPGGEMYGAEDFEGIDTKYPGHLWIFDGNKHYDSECPEGVFEWRDLPIYKRYRNGDGALRKPSRLKQDLERIYGEVYDPGINSGNMDLKILLRVAARARFKRPIMLVTLETIDLIIANNYID